MPNTLSPEVRRLVAERAAWRCEYCLLREEDSGYRHQLDHIVSRKHGGASSPENLAFACAACNRYKGSDVAALDASRNPIPLFHPRQELWPDHFRFEGPWIRHQSPVGEATIRLLRLNDPWRIQERLALLAAASQFPRTD